MRLAVVQTNPIFGEIKKNIASVVELMSSKSADLYVMPELFNTGYNFKDMQEVRQLAEPQDGPTCRELLKFAKANSCYIAYGFAEKSDKLYNSALLVGPEGLIGLYRKIHLFYRENLFFSRGNLGFPVFKLPFGTVGLMICFDWIYPEAARTLTMKGAQLILHPSNLVLPHCPDSMIVRCLENRIFTVTADRVGREDRGGIDLTFIGQSEIVSPRGEVLVRLGGKDPGIAVAEIDLSMADGKKVNEHNDLLKDRREELYF
jgi:predicted amidohydrolase